MKESKQKRLFIIILLFIGLVMVFTTGVYSYSKYRLQNQGDSSNIDIAKWDISLLDGQTDITQTKTLTFAPNSDNTYVRENMAAPGSLINTNFKIDPTKTEVAFDFNVSVDNGSFSNLGINLYLDSVTAKIGNKNITFTKIKDETTDIYKSSKISLDDISDMKTNNELIDVTISLYWDYDDSEENYDDTNFSLTTNDAVPVPVTVSLYQIIDN